MINVESIKSKKILGCAIVLHSLSYEDRSFVSWLSETMQKVIGCTGTQDLEQALIYDSLKCAKLIAQRIEDFYDRQGSTDSATVYWIVEVVDNNGTKRITLGDLIRQDRNCKTAQGIGSLAKTMMQAYGNMVATPPF